MDGVGNAAQHAKYIYAVMKLEDLHKIQSIADFGFGIGALYVKRESGRFSIQQGASRNKVRQTSENFKPHPPTV